MAKPPRSVVSGATGLIGRGVVERLLAEGHQVVVAGRRPPPAGYFSGPVSFSPDTLDPDEDHTATFERADNFIHAALDHLPGRYRGGEGDDPQGFIRLNRDGTLARFRAAKAAGVRRIVFFSTRAVYGGQPAHAVLTEQTVPAPNSLYGEIKLACERGLAEICDGTMRGVSLRVTGVYGPPPPGRRHKWADLIEGHLAGKPQPSRSGTEVHSDDVAWAVMLALGVPLAHPHEVLCVSDLIVDHADILAIANDAAGCTVPLPLRADTAMVHPMDAGKLRRIGWRPGGARLLDASVRELVASLGLTRKPDAA